MKVFHALTSLLLLLTLVLSAQAQRSDTGRDAGLFRTSSSYKISPLDVLRIKLFVADELQFEKEVRVSQEGRITLPHIGEMVVAGLTVDEARSGIYAPYNRDFYVDPQIDFIVSYYASRSVLVTGKVNRQGTINFPSEEPMYLLEAIAEAGGWSNDNLANKREVKIHRTREDGSIQVIEIDARNLGARDHPLQDGDRIEVPRRII